MLGMVIPVVLIILSSPITHWSFQGPESADNIREQIRRTTKYMNYIHPRHHIVQNPELAIHNTWISW